MGISDVGEEIYDLAFEGLTAGKASPYKKIREWSDNYDFIDGRYVRPKAKGRNTDLRVIDLHQPEDEDLFHKDSEGFFVQGDEYGILLRPKGRKSKLNGAKKYHVAGMVGLENLDYEYGRIVDNNEFELVARELNEFTDIDSFLDSREVYVDEVNTENAGSETFKYRKTAEEDSEEKNVGKMLEKE